MHPLIQADGSPRMAGPDTHQSIQDPEIFAPSPDDYPDLLNDHLQPELPSTHSVVDHNGRTSLRLLLDKIRTDIEHWQFVMEYDDIPDIIWDLWKMHKYHGTIHDFEEILEDAIKDGEKFIDRLMGITAAVDAEEIGNIVLKEWCAEISSLMSQVHRAMASISLKLDLVRGWQVKKYPAILCPRDLDS
jgi:hypothetical protein